MAERSASAFGRSLPPRQSGRLTQKLIHYPARLAWICCALGWHENVLMTGRKAFWDEDKVKYPVNNNHTKLTGRGEGDCRSCQVLTVWTVNCFDQFWRVSFFEARSDRTRVCWTFLTSDEHKKYLFHIFDEKENLGKSCYWLAEL